MIGHEEGVELAGLELSDQLLDMPKIEIGVRPGPRIAPRAGVNADRAHERAKLESPLCHRPVSVLGVVRENIGMCRSRAIGAGAEEYFVFMRALSTFVIPGCV